MRPLDSDDAAIWRLPHDFRHGIKQTQFEQAVLRLATRAWASSGDEFSLPPFDPPRLTTVYLEMRDDLGRFAASRLGGRGDVEDVLQELFLKVSRTPADAEIRDPRAYLYRLTNNLLLDRWRSSRRSAARDGAWRVAMHGAEDGDDVDDAPSAEAVVAGRQRLQALMTALDQLPEKTRTIFRLHKFDGLSYAEVAEKQGISRSSVEKHMMDALRILAARMRK